jgi:uncharacterized protein (TIGR03435 family)
MRFIATMLITGTTLLAQAPPPAPAFEVASVKLSSPEGATSGTFRGMRIDKTRFVAGHQSLRTLIFWAYKVKEEQVSGPEWLDRVYVDIEAKLPDGATEDQAWPMVQTLLADRFKMTVHRENREQAIYALVVGKNGLKMKAQEPVAESETPPPPGSTTVGLPGSEFRLSKDGSLSGGGVKMSRDQNGMHVEAFQIAALAGFLSEFLGRPVVDKTNLKGSYAIRFDISLDELMQGAPGHGAGTVSDPGGPEMPFLNAVEKLGLKLEPQKSPVETIVVEHIERTPSEN